MRFRVLATRLALLCALGGVTPALQAETFPFYREHVLGTSLEVQVDADDQQTADAAEAAVMAEIDRLSKIFSSYDPESELSRWTAQSGEAVTLSPELMEVLRMSDRWREASHGAFNPAVESLTRLWRAAEKTDVAPTDAELTDTIRAISAPQWSFDESSKARRLSTLPLTFNAIAKGYIVDRAGEQGQASSGVHGILVSVGGDMRARGSMVRRIAITDPKRDAVNGKAIDAVFLNDRGLATSGNYRRGFQVGKQWYSHILDPWTGRPADGIATAVVTARTTAEADALATICSVLPVAESLALIGTVSGAECLLVESSGAVHQSAGWRDGQQPGLYRLAERATQFVAAEGTEEAKPAAKPELLEIEVKFTLAKSDGRGYRRPYVAVWLEDADEFPVKTPLLWMTTKQPGPRWHRDLIRWYRNDRTRKLADDTDLIGTIAGATRGPGEYKAVFDGLDDAGKPLKPGKYTLYLEVAREHGTYQLIRQPLTLGTDPIAATKLKGNVEVESASYEYRAPAAAAAKSN